MEIFSKHFNLMFVLDPNDSGLKSFIFILCHIELSPVSNKADAKYFLNILHITRTKIKIKLVHGYFGTH